MSEETPPPPPWRVGVDGDAGVVEVRVLVRRDKYDRTWSYHDLAEGESRAVSLRWPTGGVRHVAEALLVEGMRRHAVLTLLREATRDPAYLDRVRHDPEGAVGALTPLLREALSRVTSSDEVLAGAVRDAILDVAGMGPS